MAENKDFDKSLSALCDNHELVDINRVTAVVLYYVLTIDRGKKSFVVSRVRQQMIQDLFIRFALTESVGGPSNEEGGGEEGAAHVNKSLGW